MVRFFRSGKWDMILLFVCVLNAIRAHLGVGCGMLQRERWRNDWWIGVAVLFLLVSAGFGYWAAQRIQRQIDMLSFGLKQAAHGNYGARLPEEGARLRRLYPGV